VDARRDSDAGRRHLRQTQADQRSSLRWCTRSDDLIDELKQRARGMVSPIGGALARAGVTPNALTIVGCLLNVAVAAVIATGDHLLGGILMLLVAAFDTLDGAVARAANLATPFGAFLDSTLDRYSEALVFGGIIGYGVLTGSVETTLLAYAAAVGSLLVSYARARAEGLGLRGDVGWLQRPERIILLGVGLIAGLLVPALCILAVLTNFTALQRILHVRNLTAGK
jgi:CDP-diacylglycerol---glycerol-3-phosphate 3-phosphatidyltransferase